MVRWLVAKYMEDLRRREPINVGVVLDFNGVRYARFVGQKPDGRIDGRRSKWAGPVDAYRSWVEYWLNAVNTERGDIAQILAKRVGDENYFVEFSGERIIGADAIDARDLLDNLYSQLVEESDKSALNVTRLSEIVLSRVGIMDRVEKDFRIVVPDEAGVEDSVTFDYRYDNGAINLMQKVSLVYPDERSWDTLHAAIWALQAGEERRIDSSREQRIIALVKKRERDADLARQLRLIERHAELIDVGNQDEATTQLANVLHLN